MSYLKKDEALWMVASFLFILMGIPDFQLPLAVSVKSAICALLVALVLLIVSYLIYHEKSQKRTDKEAQLGSVVDQFVQTNQTNENEPFMRGEYVLVLIPAYNEEHNLRQLLKSAPKTVCGLPVVILVIDDGSSDKTNQAAREYSYVVSLPENKGGGYALLTGFAIAKKLGTPYVVTMDADGQHRFSDLKDIVSPIIEKKTQVVLGSRFQTGFFCSNKLRNTGIRFFNFILRIFLGHKVSDCSNSYRAFSREALKQLDLQEERHHTAEFMIRAAKKGIHTTEIPVHVESRLSGKSKKGSSLIYPIRFGRTILTSWWRT